MSVRGIRRLPKMAMPSRDEAVNVVTYDFDVSSHSVSSTPLYVEAPGRLIST